MACLQKIFKRSLGYSKLVELPLVPAYDGAGVVVCLTINSPNLVILSVIRNLRILGILRHI